MIWKIFRFTFIKIIGRIPAKEIVDYMINIVPPERRKELIAAMAEAAVRGSVSR